MSLNTTPRTFVTGEVETAAIFNAEVRDALAGIQAAWTAYTPTLTNITQGNGTMTAKYLQVGKTVRGRIIFAAGSTTTFAAGALQFSVPVTAVYDSTAQYNACGSVWVSNGGTGSFYSGTALLLSASGMAMHVSAAVNVITNLIPVTWAASNARFTLAFQYEAA